MNKEIAKIYTVCSKYN